MQGMRGSHRGCAWSVVRKSSKHWRRAVALAPLVAEDQDSSPQLHGMAVVIVARVRRFSSFMLIVLDPTSTLRGCSEIRERECEPGVNFGQSAKKKVLWAPKFAVYPGKILTAGSIAEPSIFSCHLIGL